MTPGTTLTRAAFRRRLMIITALVSVVTILLISGYLLMLLQLPAEQWVGFGQIVTAFFLVLFPLSNWSLSRTTRAVTDYLAARETGGSGDEGLEEAFGALSSMPRANFLQGLFWWFVGGVLVGGTMYLRYDAFGAFPAVVMVLAATSGGSITSTFLFFIYKRQYADFRADLATRIGDAERRTRRVAPVPIRQKLVVAITGVTFVTVTFAMCLAYVVSSRRLEIAMTGAQGRLLEEATSHLAADAPAVGSPEWLAESTERAGRLGLASSMILLDPETGDVVGGPPDALFPSEIRTILEGGDGGSSDEVDSPNAYAWRRLGSRGPVAVMVKPWHEIGGGSESIGTFMGAMLLVAAGISLALARVLARDLGETASEIQAGVERMTAGDLRPGLVVESEDELGALARSFEQMSDAVRAIVGRVAGAADRVDGTAGEIASMAQSISAGATAQGEGVKQAAALMEGLNRQVEGVRQSAQDLNRLVEESSSSILEMGAAGEELNDTAGVLLSKVDEVSSSIEQMVRSVKQIASSTEGLSEASGETSASMEEMASAMRQVDVIAEQTAQLSRQVIENAEKGHARVRLTIQGMESIRSATSTAERVIRGLGDRTKEIGAILDVIDDVADETNLLALNAAIIAAQAGDQGRAFSVVADEIKELADRVLSSTKEIGALIRAVQDESSNAVGAIEEGSRSVASGVELSMEAGASLEDITRASRESGTRIQEIVQAVREQTKAAGHVVELMERVSDGVQAIRRATSEQDRGNEVVFRSAVGMREVATQLRSTTEEQARGGARIRESIEGVRDAVEAINRAIQIQSESNSELVRFLEEVSSRSVSNEASASRLEESTRGLREQSDSLHDDVRRFQI